MTVLFVIPDPTTFILTPMVVAVVAETVRTVPVIEPVKVSITGSHIYPEILQVTAGMFPTNEALL